MTTNNTFLHSWWRKLGLAAIGVAGVMAIASVPTGILHDTVVHAVRASGKDLPKDVSASAPLAGCIVYWCICLSALLTALSMAILDVRHIRLAYSLEKQALLREGLGEELAESVSQDRGKH